ncbi:exopolysaccharide production repressor protein [Mesorhizobium hawassense]|nr:exopolysaccharide production repressor protein [Mesorhizobium hawassense]
MGEIVDDRTWSRRSVGQMYFPQFLVGMVATLLVILGWTFMSTGSAWEALGWTVLAAVLLQAGYFVAVLWLVQREGHAADQAKPSEGAASPAKLPGPFERDGIIQALLSRLFPKVP